MALSNNPPILVEMDAELADFLIQNCETNMAFALQFLQKVDRPTAEKLIEQNEKFKRLREAVLKARSPDAP